MKADDTIAPQRNRYIRILGICWILYGVVRLFEAVWLVSFSNTATVMFGALLSRVHDPFSMMRDFHFVYAFIEALSVVSGVLGIFAGWTILADRGFGRTLALLAGFLSLSDIPLGMTLGIYTLVVLFPWNAAQPRKAVLRPHASDLTSHPSAS
jgi:hypothetical protein